MMKLNLSIYQLFAVLLQRGLAIKMMSRKPTYEDLEQRIKELEKRAIESKGVQETLRISELRYQDLYDNAPDMYFTVGEDGTILSVNLFGAEYLGFSREELVGKSVWRIVHPDDQSRIQYQVQNSFKQQLPESTFEFRKVRKDGSVLWVNEQARLILGGGEALPELRIICRDITERKQAEHELHQAKEEAEHANAIKSRFLAAASHDLRQPLQTITLLKDILSKTVKDQTSQRLIHNLGDSIAVMASLLDALLDINKLESGVITPVISAFKVNKLLRGMRTEFRGQAKEKGLDLRVVPCRVTILSDEALLQRITRNFISNAIHHTNSGKVLLGCRRRGPNLRIEVWDTGPGIPKEQLEVIFEDYYQLDNPARDRRKGLGLGLAIVDRAARLLGHSLDLQSTLNAGSMFAVEVPIDTSTARRPSTTRPRKPIDYQAPQDTSILLIEDDPDVLNSTRLLLETLGFEVITATSTSEAMHRIAVEAVRPSLIMADYRLPGNNTGAQVIQGIRETIGKEIPAMLITGDTSREVLNTALAGDFQILQKPVDCENLITFIEQLLNGAGR